MIRAIQLVEPFDSGHSASEAFNQLKTQDGFLGGRVLGPAPSRPDWRVQAFFRDDGDVAPDRWLPDGLRRVVIPEGMAKMLGILS